MPSRTEIHTTGDAGSLRPAAPAAGRSASAPAAALAETPGDLAAAMEASLREREQELALARRLARLGTWRWLLTVDQVLWSPEVFSAFGLPAGSHALRAPALRELLTPESMAALEAAIGQAKIAGTPYSLDVEIRTPEGTSRWAAVRGEPALRDGSGAIVELRGTVQDITERKHAEQVIARSEARYRALLRASSDLIWTTNAHGETIDALPEWQAFTGQTDLQVRGSGWADAIHPDDREPTLALWQAAVQSGSTFVVPQQRLRRSDGVYRIMEVCAVPSLDATGRILEWVGTHTDITDRITAEAAMRETQSRFQRLYESNLIGICYPDRFGAFSDGNDEFLRIVGYTREDLAAGQVRWDTMTPPEYVELDRRHIAEAAARQSCTPYEKEFLRKDGSRVPILCGYALREGSADEYIGFIMDITAAKLAEASLRDRERTFRELAETLPQLVWSTDAATGDTYINQRFVDYTGHSSHDLHGDDGFLFVHPEDRAVGLQLWQRCIATGDTYVNQVRMRRWDGAYRYHLSRAVPIHGPQGQLERWVGSATDIHDQRLAEDALRASETHFRDLAESLPLMVWVSGPSGHRTYSNRRYADYTGVPVESLAGAGWRSVVHPADLPGILQLWQHAMAAGEPYTAEYRVRRADGVYRTHLARAVPVRTPDGDIERWIGSATDIHDQRLADEALRRSEKLAATGRLAASIAHEINNPLAAVTNCLFLALQDPGLSDETRQRLTTADRELARVAHLTTQTLRFHKQTAGPVAADLCTLLDSACALFEGRFAAFGVTLSCDYRTHQLVLCRADELRQVFANFLANALDALRASGGRIRLRVAAAHAWDADRTPGVRVTIADTGHGIRPEVVPSIFDAFFTTREATGTGLGLWVSADIVHKHRGRVRLRSSVRETRSGTVFQLFFPLSPGPLPANRDLHPHAD